MTIPGFKEGNPDHEMLRRTAEQLVEHFETVQIFASRRSPDGCTDTFQLGLGSFYTREAQIREWVVKMEERVREEARHDFREENP